MTAGHARSRKNKPSAADRHVELLAAFGRHEKTLAEVNAHLATLVELTTKQRLGSPHLSISEAAAYLGITKDTLQGKMGRGDVPFHRRPGTAPYFLKHEIDEWLSDPETLCATNGPARSLETPNGNKKKSGPLDGKTIRRLLEEGAEFPDACKSRR